MAKRHDVRQMIITSDTNNRSGLVTTKMTSSTADHVVGTSFKGVQVDENGEFVVSHLWFPVTYIHWDATLTASDANKTFMVEDSDAIGWDNYAEITLPPANSVSNWDIIIIKNNEQYWEDQEVVVFQNGSDLFDKYYSALSLLSLDWHGRSGLILVSDWVDSWTVSATANKVPFPPVETGVSRIHIDSWALIQGNIYPDYQEQTMTILADRYMEIKLPNWYSTITITDIRTVLHDDTVRTNIVLNIRNNWTNVHTITLPNGTSVLNQASLSIPFINTDKLSIEVTTAPTGNTIGAEIFMSYEII